MRVCNSCKTAQPLENFWKQAASKDKIQLCCKSCAARTNKNQRERNYHKFWAAAAIGSHRARGIEVTLGRDELAALGQAADNCPRCGTVLKWRTGRLCPESPTLDRIDNDKGLIPGNVQIACLRCNSSKGQLSMQQYRAWVKVVHDRLFGEKDV